MSKEINQNSADMHVHLTRAVMSNNTKLAKQFIDLGADVNYGEGKGATLLHTAIQRCKPVEMIELLLQSGANPNAVPFISADLNASKKHHFYGRLQQSPMEIAAEHGNGNVVALLHKNGADVNAIGESGRTPLHIATVSGRAKAVEALIQCGADIDKRCPLDGMKAIDYAVKGSPIEAILLEAHAQKSKQNLYAELYGDAIDVESVGQATPQRKRKM